jgi:hypothetical protein
MHVLAKKLLYTLESFQIGLISFINKRVNKILFIALMEKPEFKDKRCHTFP